MSYSRRRTVLAGALGAALVLVSALRAELPEELPFVHLTTAESLASPGLQDVFQDHVGFVWIGFYSAGLSRWDGRRMETYGVADGLPDLTVRALAEDGDGYLWVGCETGLVVSAKPLGESLTERVRFVARRGGVALAATRIRRNFLAVDGRGAMWVATTGEGVLSYEPAGPGRSALVARRHSTDLDGDGSDDVVRSIGARRDGSVWAGLVDGTLLRFGADGSRITLGTAAAALGRSAITVLHESASGELWIAAENGAVGRLSSDGSRFETVSRELHEPPTSMVDGENGELWVASLGDGVLRIAAGPAGAVRHYRRPQGLLNDTVPKVLRDREGTLWFAQFGGLSRLRRDFAAYGYVTGASHAGEPPALPETTALVVAAGTAAHPTTWVGTSGGVVGFAPDGRRVRLDHASGLSSNEVYAIGRDGAGRLWIGTLGGLDVVASEETMPPPLPWAEAGRPPVAVGEVPGVGSRARVASLPLGAVYGCTALRLPVAGNPAVTAEAMCFPSTSGLACLVDGRWQRFGRDDGLPAAGATAVAVGADRRLWVGTHRDGLLRSRQPVSLALLAGGAAGAPRRPLFEPVAAAAPAASSGRIVRDLAVLGGDVWVATAAGLEVLGGEPPALRATLGEREGLGGENVFSIALSPRGSLWVAQSRGLAEVDPATRTVLRRVSRADGLVDDEAWVYDSLDVAPDGTVLLATPRGVTTFRPALAHPVDQPPPVVLRGASFHERWNGDNEASFEFAALSFAAEESVRFRTRLVGYDDWSAPTPVASLRYTNLPAFLVARTYRFEVVARNHAGPWTPAPATWEVRVHPAWWLRWWAFAGYLLLFVATVVSWNAWRTRALERVVAARTAEVRAQAEELAALDDIVEAINRHVEIGELLRALLEKALVVFPQAEKAVFVAVDHEAGRTEVIASVGYDANEVDGVSFSLDEAIHRYVSDSEAIDEGVYLLRSFEGRAGAQKVSHLPTPKSTLAMSVTLGGRLEGFLALDNFARADAFHRSDVRTLARLRRHAVTAIAKARAMQEIREASARKSAFLASMSHELRTPLNSIIGFAEILATRLEGRIEPRYHGFLQTIEASGQHLLAVINEVLDISKVEAGKMEVLAEAFPLPAVLGELVAAMSGVAAKQGVELRLQVDPALATMESDPVKVRQIVTNLLSNAVKFSPPGAAVRVEARREGDDSVAIAVVDQGVGLSAAEIARIFDEFEQAGPADRRRQGTGLGLPIVRRFVTLLGGTIDVASTPGAGSTFTVRLPLRYGGVVEARRPAPPLLS